MWRLCISARISIPQNHSKSGYAPILASNKSIYQELGLLRHAFALNCLKENKKAVLIFSNAISNRSWNLCRLYRQMTTVGVKHKQMDSEDSLKNVTDTVHLLTLEYNNGQWSCFSGTTSSSNQMTHYSFANSTSIVFQSSKSTPITESLFACFFQI